GGPPPGARAVGNPAQQVGLRDQRDRPVGVVDDHQRALVGVVHQVRGGGEVPLSFDRGRSRAHDVGNGGSRGPLPRRLGYWRLHHSLSSRCPRRNSRDIPAGRRSAPQYGGSTYAGPRETSGRPIVGAPSVAHPGPWATDATSGPEGGGEPDRTRAAG